MIETMSCDITTNGFQPTAGYVVGPSGEQLTEVDGSGTGVTPMFMRVESRSVHMMAM